MYKEGRSRGQEITRVATRYTSSVSLRSTPSPQGEGFLHVVSPKGFPLRGSSAEGGDEV